MGILSKVYTGKKVKEMAKTPGRNVSRTPQNRPASTLPQRNKTVENDVASKRTVDSIEDKKDAQLEMAASNIESTVTSVEKERTVASNYEVSTYDKEKYEAELKEFLEVQIQTVIDTQASKYEQRLEEYKEALSLYKKCLAVFEDRLEEIGSIGITANDTYKDDMIKEYDERVQNYDNRLGEYDERVQNYDNRLGEYDQRVQNYDSRLGEYDEKVREYDDRVRDYDAKVQSYDSRLGEYDEKVREYDDKVKEYDQRVQSYDSRLGEYDERVREYDDRVREYDAKVKGYDSRLGVYDEKVRDYDSRLGDYDERVRGYDSRLEEYTQQLKHYEDKLSQYEKQNLSDQEVTKKINTDIAFIKSESEKIKKQIDEIKVEPDEEFTKSIEKMLTSQEGVGEFIKNFDARVGAVIKEDSEEKKKVASYQFDMLMDMIKKGNSDNKQLLLGVLGVNFILLVINIILIFMSL